MANIITQNDVMNVLHNLMGHRVNPGGTDDDLKRFAQDGMDYCWRYYKWTFALQTATIAIDGLLPADFDLDGWRKFNGVTEVPIESTISAGNSGSAIVWDKTVGLYRLTPPTAGTVAYQTAPPTLGEVGVPFPSAKVVAMGGLIYAKISENPTRADVQQEWDMLHSELDRLVGRADNNKSRSPQSYHDKMGTFVGDVG